MINLKSKGWLILLFFVSSLSFSGFCQSDYFADYHPLQSIGRIPTVFTQSTESKIEAAKARNRASMDENEERVFLEYIHHHVDEILQSGLILYGDVTTKYVQKVADKLLENEPKLKKELQFYVIKSNVTNALSTDQGIIFVTLGLLAQLENEAQLAYVLAHEIVHFQETHVEKSYAADINTEERVSYDQRITRLSNHSRDQELEADKKGVHLYHQAGYSEDELLGAFDVMMYSYLPFDDVPFDRDYFRTDLLNIPDYYYPRRINDIQAEEDYDDRKSSHPNIRKRKDQIMEELSAYDDWGDAKYLLTEEEFKEVRTIARFEGVRLDLLAVNYGDALYSIYLLEREFPNNLYLNRMKSQAWLGLAGFKLHGEFSKTSQKPTSVEGESHAVHFLLRKLTKLQLLTISLRQIEDAYIKFPEDKELTAIREQMIRLLAGYKKFKVSDYVDVTYEEALKTFEESKAALAADTLEVEVESDISSEEDEDISKYERIKKKRNTTEAVTKEDEFDIKKFYIYALTDIIKDADFKRVYLAEKEKIKERKDEETRLWSLTKREREEHYAELAASNSSEDGYILIEPSFSQYRYGVPYLDGAAEREEVILSTLKSTAKKFNVTIHDLSSDNTSSQNTSSYNERAILMDYLRQKAEFEDFEMFPVDYSRMGDIKQNYGDSKLLFVFAEYNRTRITHKTELSAFVIDMETGDLDLVKDHFFTRRPRKLVLKGYVYDLISQLRTPNN
ncbi:MAG: M48 family metalloprotease [Crocinitomicaceae bacterium]|nr:M48 family metalloprotease [Crocinitomicaceae bacterium]